MQRFLAVFGLLAAAANGQLHPADNNCPLDLGHDRAEDIIRPQPKDVVPEPRATQEIQCNDPYRMLQSGVTYEISSPNFPNVYNNNEDCNYRTDVPAESTVRLECRTFYIYGRTNWRGQCSWNYDYLALIADGELLGVACGRELEDRYMEFTVSEWFRIAFETNGSYRTNGFQCFISIQGGNAPTAAPTTAAPTAAPTTAAPTAAPTTAAPPVTGNDICQRCGTGAAGSRVVNGVNAQVCEHPWQVRWISSRGHVCGGTIVGHNTVITAAHCTDGFSASQMSVFVGSQNNYGQDGVRFTPTQLIQHPGYDGNAAVAKDDISILKFNQDLLAATSGPCSSPQPACLPATNANDEGVTADISGWGTTSSGGSLSSTLQSASVQTITASQCRQSYGSYFNEAKEICAAGTRNGQNVDTCQGDSGGPLVTSGTGGRETLIGVVSWGSGCAGPSPGVYARVSNYQSWIRANAGDDFCFV